MTAGIKRDQNKIGVLVFITRDVDIDKGYAGETAQLKSCLWVGGTRKRHAIRQWKNGFQDKTQLFLQLSGGESQGWMIFVFLACFS